LLHWCLRPTRLPIPPPGQKYDAKIEDNLSLKMIFNKN